MRITRDTLLKHARQTVSFRMQQDKTVVCVYLTGSLLNEDPVIGGTADIDLVFVHDRLPKVEREVVRVTDEVTFDIAHYSQMIYDQPRRLRLNPWLGSYMIADPLLLYETQHWFEYTQASVAAQFYQPDTVLARVRPLADYARQVWMDFSSKPVEPGIPPLLVYLKALESAGNAVACLYGTPLPERRFFTLFPKRALKAGKPDLTSSLIGLFLRQPPDDELWTGWLIDWENIFNTVSVTSTCPVKLQPPRKGYYLNAMRNLHGDNAPAALWILLRTWSLLASHLRSNAAALHPYNEFRRTLGLDEGSLKIRFTDLDRFLDRVDETLDDFALSSGIR
jgi:hypothetical protein